MKRPLAALATLILMGGMLWAGLRHRASPAVGAPHDLRPPSDAGRPVVHDLSGASRRIEVLLDGARRGDVAAYLASFDGPLRNRLEQQADERGRGALAAELRRAAQARQSHAVFAPVPDGEDPDAAWITVESIFADRIERQTYHLTRRDAAWLVNDVETPRDRVPKNPLGSLATFREPEGVPVARDETTAR
jgi:hypothetical protein